jgi:hypothetical protein
MNVRLGWSGEVHGTWTKLDVEVEESDLLLHFKEFGAEDTDLPLKPLEKFKLMYSIAEIFVQVHKMSRFPEYFDKEDDREELAKLVEARNRLTREVIARVN